ncbi:1-acyl-sn-glycerol-3-phosphate acyltransferase [Nocardioides silvaticus]|uniref:1-acyl-sn-glycerol-3-phosphate acyltransferase n=1 Tax=Nocardioides silvaticus TaxID=2201891 RepID=A0A316TKH6_9ACTN|nr:lysophospholipid acyltransferase family protein [Nocardioides silvaticus]PWN04268.1 1-acyl-sn-glycerol-3-phosphate acyltransferase [Nocardioides silvaticus]
MAWWVAFLICKPILMLVRRRDWRGVERIPARGPVVLAANHVSELDPLLVAEMVLAQGRTPAFLAKSSLFEEGIVGRWFRAAGHVEVDRSHGADGFGAALAALRSGALLVVYPEGTITKDPDGRLMELKTGAVRLALESGAPLIPVAQRGAEEILPAYSHRPKLFKRPTVTIDIGPPLDLTDLRQLGPDPEAVIAGTRRLADALTRMLDQVAERRGASHRPTGSRQRRTSW